MMASFFIDILIIELFNENKKNLIQLHIFIKYIKLFYFIIYIYSNINLQIKMTYFLQKIKF